jgi:hypothetical protein
MLHVIASIRAVCPCFMSTLHVHSSFPCFTNVHAVCPHRISLSVPFVKLHVHASCLSVLHVRAYCPGCLSVLHVRTTCSCCIFLLHVQGACQCFSSKLLANAASPCCMSLMYVNATFASFTSMLYVRASCSCQCRMSLLHFHAARPCPWAVLSWQAGPDSPVLAVLFCQSFSAFEREFQIKARAQLCEFLPIVLSGLVSRTSRPKLQSLERPTLPIWGRKEKPEGQEYRDDLLPRDTHYLKLSCRGIPIPRAKFPLCSRVLAQGLHLS